MLFMESTVQQRIKHLRVRCLLKSHHFYKNSAFSNVTTGFALSTLLPFSESVRTEPLVISIQATNAYSVESVAHLRSA